MIIATTSLWPLLYFLSPLLNIPDIPGIMETLNEGGCLIMKSRKIWRTVIFSLVLSCCLTLMCSCGEANSGRAAATQTPQPGREVTAIILSAETIEITAGDTYQMTYMVLPDGASDQTLTWKSTDEAKVIVDEAGVITAVAEGQANIIAYSENGVYATCKVTVKEP